MVLMGILDCEQWVFGAHDKISALECERSISGVSKPLAMAILGSKTHVHLCPTDYNRRGRLQLWGRMQAHGSNCAVRSKRRRDIDWESKPRCAGAFLEERNQAGQLSELVSESCEVTLSFQLVPVNIISGRSILAQSIHSSHYFGRG